MSKGLRLDWFEIPVLDMDRAITFYEKVFDISIKPMSFGNLEMGWFPPSGEAGAATGTLIKQESYIPSDTGALLYFHSEDITTELNKVVTAGGAVFLEKRAIGEGQGFMGVFIDSEGNRIALHSTK